MSKLQAIPPMTDPLGRYWDQPPSDMILIDETHALMEQATFNKLMAYDSSNPSGVYVGKMWSRTNRGGRWLCWYGEDLEPGYCSNHYREVLIL